MELRQLEYFEAVSRHRNFTRAAQELHVTQPTVTTGLKNLEWELGVSLLNRESGTPELTPAGEEVLMRTRIILRNVAKIRERAAMDGLYTGEIAIGIPPISCASLYPAILGEFAAAHPEIHIQVEDRCNHETIQHLLEEDLDLGFIILPGSPHRDLEYLPIEKSSLRVLLSKDHPLASHTELTPEELAGEKILMYEKGTSYIEVRMEQEFRSRGLPWHVEHHFSNFSTIYDLTAQNFGIAFTMPTDSPSLRALPGLVAVPFRDPLEYEVGLAWSRKKYLTPACRELIRFIREKG